MTATKPNLKSRRRVFTLTIGEREVLKRDLDRYHPGRPDAAQLYDWVKNNRDVWERVDGYLTAGLDAIYLHDPESVTNDHYSWGINFNLFYVRKCHVSDFLGGFLDQGDRSAAHTAADELAKYVATEWSLRSGVKLGKSVFLA
jgi:hypothetical protein